VTNFSPFELVFGKKANIFESNENECLSNTEQLELEQRRNQIRSLYESLRNKAIVNTKQAQEIQKQHQDKNQYVSLTFLALGTVVYLKNEGIIPKLNSRYKGPYKILGRDEWENYILEDATGKKVDDKFPLSKLKVVKKEIKEKSYEVEKILDHKTVKNKLKFLIKWKGSPNNTWETDNSFDSKVLINRYWESIKKTKPSRQSNRLKVNNSVIFNVCFVIPLLLSLVSATPINNGSSIKQLELDSKSPANNFLLVEGKFKFCSDVKQNNPINLESICDIPEIEKSANNQQEFSSIFAVHKQKESMFTLKRDSMGVMKKFVNIDVFTKELNSVFGKGFECIQTRKFKKFTETIILNRFEVEWYEQITLTDLDCSKMVKYKQCGKSKNKMECDNNNLCSFSEAINPEYSWGQSIVKAGDVCIFKERDIIAEDKNSYLFGTECKGTDLHCQVGDSMIIWSDSIVHKCPFRRIMKHLEVEVTERG